MPGLAVGRVIEKVESIQLADGVAREFRFMTATFQDANGIWRTLEHVTVTPPLDCNCAPRDLHDVTICHLCSAVICVSKHSMQCPACGRTACSACRVQITVEDQPVAVCAACAKEAQTPWIFKILQKAIWG
jgi:hypothetical protein